MSKKLSESAITELIRDEPDNSFLPLVRTLSLGEKGELSQAVSPFRKLSSGTVRRWKSITPTCLILR